MCEVTDGDAINGDVNGKRHMIWVPMNACSNIANVFMSVFATLDWIGLTDGFRAGMAYTLEGCK